MCAVGGGWGERGGAWASQHTHFHELCGGVCLCASRGE